MTITDAALCYHGFNASLIYPASNKRGHLRSQNINSSQIPASDWIRSFDSGGIWTIPARYIWLRSFLRSSFSATADSASFLSWNIFTLPEKMRSTVQQGLPFHTQSFVWIEISSQLCCSFHAWANNRKVFQYRIWFALCCWIWNSRKSIFWIGEIKHKSMVSCKVLAHGIATINST